jgi:hypothetical protein
MSEYFLESIPLPTNQAATFPGCTTADGVECRTKWARPDELWKRTIPTPVADAADVVKTAAPGNCAEPVMRPSTPRLYLWSRSDGVMMHFAASRALHFFTVLVMIKSYLS